MIDCKDMEFTNMKGWFNIESEFGHQFSSMVFKMFLVNLINEGQQLQQISLGDQRHFFFLLFVASNINSHWDRDGLSSSVPLRYHPTLLMSDFISISGSPHWVWHFIDILCCFCFWFNDLKQALGGIAFKNKKQRSISCGFVLKL